MTLFVSSVVLVLVVSAICSLSEAALYSVRMPYVRQLVKKGSRAGMILDRFKRNMERPITAILIVNTAANTAGAAVAGAQARLIFGEAALFWFSALFTLSVLFFSEILPKIAGVTYRRTVAKAISLPLDLVIRALYPLVWLSRQAARFLKSGEPESMASEEEVYHIAALSAEEGSILPVEAALIKNVLRLNEVRARDIMTPRTVVFKLAAGRTVGDVAKRIGTSAHSRIPIHADGDQEKLTGWVLKSDVFARLVEGDLDVKISALAKPIGFVPDGAPGHLLLKQFLKQRAHILAVVDEYGGVSGVVTLEDVMESLLGEEIVDETDAIVNFQEEARQRGKAQFAQSLPTDDSRDATDSPLGMPRTDE